MAKEKKAKKARLIRRPNRPLFIFVTLIAAVVLVLNLVLVAVVPVMYDTINGFLTPAATGEQVDETRAASEEMTQTIESEGIVLLENNDSTLPLASGTKVNLFGYGSRDTVYGGSGSGSGDSSNAVTIAEGLENAGFTVNPELIQFYDENYVERTGVGFTGNNFDINEPSRDQYSDELLANAEAYSDVAIFVVSRLGGEGADLPMDMDPDLTTTFVASGAVVEQTVSGGDAGKHYLELQSVEQEVLDMVKSRFDKVIVLVNSTNCMELGFLEDEGIDAALWVGCLGSTGANAIGQVISGEVNPSGRLTDTFAYELESAPSYYSLGDYDYTNAEWVNTNLIGNSKDPDAYHYVDYIEGIYVGYRYYETAAEDGFIDYDSTVQYPFGYGLSYTTFDQQIESFDNDGETITMGVRVTNTGDVAGKDVVQAYYSAPYTQGGIEKSSCVLGGFGKTDTLEPGQSQLVTVSWAVEDMASYDYSGIKADGGAYVLEAGDYGITLRNNSHDVLDTRTVTIDADVIYNDANDGARSSDNVAATNLFDDVSFGECTNYVSRADWAGTFPTERAAFSREASDATLAVINDTDPVFDNSADPITTGAKNGLTLADVAGLDYDDPTWDELLDQVTLKEMVSLVGNGGWSSSAVSSVGKLHYSEVDGPNGVNNIMAGTTGNQFCAQSVLACSWNTSLAQEFGRVFAEEAEALEVSALYAPAMNIHRSPFSGRNYEYCSEDALLSGMMCASEIQGLQSVGVTAYAKHFAVNDQETNRDSGGLATWLTEQAMREIYLKPFEIAVKDGGTLGIMSSFNRLGATCAAESSELLTDVLRTEWGFNGTVITDCILQLSYINVDRAVAAGNDMMLALLTLQNPTSNATETTAGQATLRQATHNILYTAANGRGQEIASGYVATGLYTAIGVVDAVIVGLLALYYVRHHIKLNKWRKQEGKTSLTHKLINRLTAPKDSDDAGASVPGTPAAV